MLAKQMRQEQKTHKEGEAFSLQAWQNFSTLPTWCKEYIQEFLSRGNKKDNFWTLLVADPLYKKDSSWKASIFGKGKKKDKDLTSVLVVFKYCSKNGLQREGENIVDTLVEKIGQPLSTFLGEIGSRIKERRRDRRSRTRSRSRSRPLETYSRSRSRARTGADIAGAGAAAAAGINAYNAKRRRQDRNDDEGFVEYGTEPVYSEEQSSGVEVELDEPEDELMKKIMVQYTGVPPSYDESAGVNWIHAPVDGPADGPAPATGSGWIEEVDEE